MEQNNNNNNEIYEIQSEKNKKKYIIRKGA